MSAVFTVAHGMDLKNVAAIIVIILCVGTIQKTTMKTTMKRIMKRTAKEIAKSEIAAKIEGLREAYDIIYRAVTWKGGMSDVQKRIAELEQANDR